MGGDQRCRQAVRLTPNLDKRHQPWTSLQGFVCGAQTMINWFIEKLRGLADLSDDEVRALELATDQARFQATRGPHPGRRPARTCVHRSGRIGSPLQGAAQQLAADHGIPDTGRRLRPAYWPARRDGSQHPDRDPRGDCEDRGRNDGRADGCASGHRLCDVCGAARRRDFLPARRHSGGRLERRPKKLLHGSAAFGGLFDHVAVSRT